ncbi:helix-turn-helix transcriptional regulator [Nocardioides sp. AE5]|uniref:helix-turn-helix domain-containing protein n=1 Tax=Nocardioides sp. AE5 TaxID=2962573 RepID=UPI00288251E5|nr:helix-turn-helix transcriptional regulator [Nocardioides sp. AE5]MDT0202324.1 helix-turn-helix transcriptional regulator [Nocardioides sp. AE5]
MASQFASRFRAGRQIANLTTRQVGALAGVSASTVSRVEMGNLNPTYDVAMRLLAAVDLDPSFQPASQPGAIATARWLLGDGECPTAPEAWLERWHTLGIIDIQGDAQPAVLDTRALALRAGRAATLTRRPGAALLRQDRGAMEVSAGLKGAGISYARTGDRAANRLVSVATDGMPVFYVNDVDDAVNALGLAYRGPREWGAPIVLLPFDGYSEAGRVGVDDEWFASDWQVVMDCYGGTDRMPEQADRVLDHLLEPSLA